MKKFKVGLQLYSICNDVEKDMDSALEQVKNMGYDYVEFAGYFGKSAEEVKAILDKYDIKAISEHSGYDKFLQNEKESIDYIKTLGMKYCAIPGMDISNHAGGENFSRTVKELTDTAKLLKAKGIQLCYHNHHYEFAKYNGEYLMDLLLESIPEIQPEFDLGWVEIAGLDPCEYIKKYSGRCEIVHLKDFKPGKDNTYEFTVLGEGVQNYEKILKAADESGVEYLIVENETPVSSRMEAVKKDREFLKSLGL